ncbi:MAG TPA: LysE family transporter [Spongiibacteraceae bacterium]|nr:LysE family transporter [Spongiibacteraceae bacterium]
MNFPELFITGFLLSISLCLDIGIVNVALIDTTLQKGPRAAALFAIGSCIGDLIYAVASLFGIGLLLQYDSVRLLLNTVGVAVLLAMAWLALRAALTSGPATTTSAKIGSDKSFLSLFFYGLSITLASPSAIIWFAAVGGSLIAQSGAHTSFDIFALLSGFFCASAGWCVFVIGAAVYGGRALGPRFQQGCHLVSALLFLYFVAKIIIALIAAI